MASETTIRVRYAETDTMGVVYYGNYLTYFEVGRVEFLRQHGFPMSAVDRKVHMPVVEASVRYVKPARLDDLLRVRCWISDRKRASFVFRYEIVTPETGEPVATGETRHACWNPETQRMIAIPDWLEPLLDPEPASALLTDSQPGTSSAGARDVVPGARASEEVPVSIVTPGRPRPITEVAASVGLGEEELIPYGRHMAKVSGQALAARRAPPPASLWSSRPSRRRRRATGRRRSPSGSGRRSGGSAAARSSRSASPRSARASA